MQQIHSRLLGMHIHVAQRPVQRLHIRFTWHQLQQPQLAEFFKAGKVQLRKFMDGIKATETLLNGRINADTVLLKVQ